jgi:hypothetical protein
MAEIPIPCTLNAGDLDARAREMRQLGERALVGVHVGEDGARLRFRGEHERIAALIAAESECCTFFEFATAGEGAETEVEIRAPEGAEPMVRGFVAAVVAGWAFGWEGGGTA